MRKSETNAVTLLALCTTVIIGYTEGLRLAACSGDHDAVELTENTSGGQTVCEDIAQNQGITWLLDTTPVATCTSPSQSCAYDSPEVFTATRNSTFSTAIFVANSNGYSGYTVTCRVGGGPEVSCPVDVVYVPLSSQVQCSVSTSSRWNIAVSCNVSKAYSTRNRYTCDVRQGSSSGPSQGRVSYSSGSSSGYVSGTCTSSFAMPTSPGTYTYTVIVYPGVSAVSASPAVTVARPSTAPVIRCNEQSGYLPENTSLTCTCDTSDLGQPQGRLQVYRGNALRVSGNYGDSSVSFGESSVSSADNMAVYKCVLDWVTADSQDINTTFTLRVAYGPSSASLTNPPVYELHPTQSSPPLTLTCTAAGVNPSANYSWSGSQCAGTTQSTCSFTPAQGDDGDVISCTAVNPITNVRRTSEQRTLSIEYPPTSAPVVSGYSGGVLYAGQTTAMTCTVLGGNPAVTSVTFTCDSTNNAVSGTSSTIHVTASRDKNGRNCTCSATWKNKPQFWYPKTASVTFQVYYPPDTPTIDYRQQRFPFLAGEFPTLYCTLTPAADPGNPPSTLTLEGQKSSQGQREVSVTLPVLTRADHGRHVVCEATNSFTEHNRTDVTGHMVLQVYYISPTITPLSSNTCTMTSANTCVVKEGQTVHLNCSAESNPSLATIAWQPQGSASILYFTANRSSPLTHLCHVTTTTNRSDNRLPLRDNVTMTVLTTYAAQVTDFRADNSSNITASEGHSMTLTCTAVGRPTPAMSIAKDDVSLTSRSQGQATAEQQATLTYNNNDVTCDATGQYRCDVDNGEGQADTTHLLVFVNCSPRLQKGSPQIPSDVNYRTGPVSVMFPLTVYPAIHTWALQYYGPVFNTTAGRPARDTLYTVHCTNPQSSRPHLTTCNLTISGATQSDKGFYDVTLSNGVGQPFTFKFQLDVNGTESTIPPIAAAVGGSVAAVVVAGGVAAGILFIRRKQTGKTKKHKRALNGRRDNEEPDMIPNVLYETTGPRLSDDGKDETMIINTIYESSETAGPQVSAQCQQNASPYEDVTYNGSRPVVAHAPLSAAAPGAKGTGLDTTKGRGHHTQPTASTLAGDDTGVNSQGGKSRKTQAAKPEVKPKPGKKPKVDKKTKNKTKADKSQQLQEKEGTVNVYSNTDSAPRATARGDDSKVYENYAFTPDDGAVDGNNVDSSEGDGGASDGGRRNADGLLYTTVAFTSSQRQKEKDPNPVRERTEYTQIDFPRKDPNGRM